MTARNNTTQQLVLAALFTAVIAVCAQISLPLPPIPASMSVFAVLLCGAVMSPKWALLSLCAYVIMGAAGLPVFAGFRGGPSVLFGPTGGYIAGYILCAAGVGLLSRRLPSSVPGLFAAMALSLPLCYIPGALWMMFITRSDWFTAVVSGVIAFIPSDLIKAMLAALLAAKLRKSLPFLHM